MLRVQVHEVTFGNVIVLGKCRRHSVVTIVSKTLPRFMPLQELTFATEPEVVEDKSFKLNLTATVSVSWTWNSMQTIAEQLMHAQGPDLRTDLQGDLRQ